MTKRMLIDSTHAEETRVVVLDGNRLEDFDVETSTKQQLKGNIYLAKVVRVEPSLQAAFVEYGGNRHGFLAFGEIHPDYYQIPIADRKRLLEAQEAEAREEEEAEDMAAEAGAAEAGAAEAGAADAGEVAGSAAEEGGGEENEADDDAEAPASAIDDTAEPASIEASDALEDTTFEPVVDLAEPHSIDTEPMPRPDQVAQPLDIPSDRIVAAEQVADLFPPDPGMPEGAAQEAGADLLPEQPVLEGTADTAIETVPQTPPPEQLGGELEERPDRRTTPRFLRNYKIQEVIRRRQILLIQVVKEERGTKGAALTTYISLAGRFSVLMPNSPRGGGISRKITSAADRRRLKEVTAELDLPRGMGLIVRTAGANRPKPEILRDCEYLLNQWDQIRELTLRSMAPALIYEEASLIKRAIRDVYSREVDDILVDGEQGWRAARDFMRMLMPTHARKVQLWKDPQPLFAKAQVESQLDAMLSPTVQLRSGGYLVINQTEALVAIDVNSGRSTRERGIEETALRTNLEAAEEAARQLRLRDLAGLIVIDFIDMESRRNNAAVERKLKESLKNDRARIQIGSISHFGLLEMSRQRLRPSLAETNFVTCPHCSGTGQVRSTESAALHVLRAIEEEGGKRRAAEVVVHVAGSIALYVLNHKRQRLAEIEARHSMHVTFASDETLLPPDARIERVRAQAASDLPAPVSQLAPPEPFEDPDELELEAEEDETAETPPVNETAEEREQRRPRRRRRRGGRREDAASPVADAAGDATVEPGEPAESLAEGPGEAEASDDTTLQASGTDPAPLPAEGDDSERRRRGRRGGRRRRRDGTTGEAAAGAESDGEPTELEQEPAPTQAYVAPAYSGPTPADPFGGSSTFDIFDALEQAEQERAAMVSAPPMPAHAEAGPEPQEPAPALVPDAVAEQPAAHIEAETAAAVEPAPEPEPVPAAPVIAPVLVGTSEVPVEKKRGWWRT